MEALYNQQGSACVVPDAVENGRIYDLREYEA